MSEVLTFDDFNVMPTPDQIRAIYESGFVGALPEDPEQYKQFRAAIPRWYNDFPEFEGAGKGKLCLPYKCALILEPEFGRYENQTTGDCVSHGTRNAGMIDYCYDAYFGETKYAGRFATENIYGMRGHSGQGANCGVLCEYVSQVGEGGFLPRAAYKEGDSIDGKFGSSGGSSSVDLSVYNSSIGHNWGRSGTPTWLNNIANENPSMKVWTCKSMAEARDALYMGYGICRCWDGGFSSQRNSDGLAEQQGRWNHSEAWIGFDDTQYAHDKYGGGLPLEQNSWGKWNGGPKRHEQPDGSYFMRPEIGEKIVKNGAMYIISAVRGISRETDASKARRAENVYESSL